MISSYFSPDVTELLALLADHGVRYLVVGGEAVIRYGYARLTGDVDLFYAADTDNAARLYGALGEFWAGRVPGIASTGELLEPGVILQFGVPPNRIDLLNRIDGVTFPECWEGRVTESMSHGGKTVAVPYIGLDELIRNKTAAARPKDLDDLRFLKSTRKP